MVTSKNLLWNLSARDCGLIIFSLASAESNSVEAHINIIATSFDFADYAIFSRMNYLSIIIKPLLKNC